MDNYIICEKINNHIFILDNFNKSFYLLSKEKYEALFQNSEDIFLDNMIVQKKNNKIDNFFTKIVVHTKNYIQYKIYLMKDIVYNNTSLVVKLLDNLNDYGFVTDVKYVDKIDLKNQYPYYTEFDAIKTIILQTLKNFTKNGK